MEKKVFYFYFLFRSGRSSAVTAVLALWTDRRSGNTRIFIQTRGKSSACFIIKGTGIYCSESRLLKKVLLFRKISFWTPPVPVQVLQFQIFIFYHYLYPVSKKTPFSIKASCGKSFLFRNFFGYHLDPISKQTRLFYTTVTRYIEKDTYWHLSPWC
jgi:hypothetical protein